MYIPDRVIVRKLKEYDRYLSLQWNNEEGYFELWREMVHGKRLITPVTESIYDASRPKVFTPLDERLLWWVVEADSWRSGGAKAHAWKFSKAYVEFVQKVRRQRKQFALDFSKDAWHAMNNFYTTKASFKPKAEVGTTNWMRPDSAALTSPRVFARSGPNALKYNFQRRG